MMEETKNVKIIFRDLDECPGIIMPYKIYDKLVNELFKKNKDNSIKFDDFVDYIRQIPISVGIIHCSSFIKWWENNSTHQYYWPICRISIFMKKGYYMDSAIISGLKNKYNKEAGGVYHSYNGHFDMRLAKGHLMYSTYGIPSQHFREAAVHIKDVIFNDPATIVFWSDGTKTVCTCSEQDIYDPEKGLALCVMKKMLYNNKGHIFNNAREKWLKKGAKKR